VTVVVEFRMPSLGADMEAGTLVEWLVKPGDRVKRGDVVAVVETQKGAIEIEIFESGQIARILVELDTKVPVGTPLAHILTGEDAKTGAAALIGARPMSAPPPAVSEIARPGPLPKPVPPVVTAPRAGRARVSPAARQLAQARGIDLGATVGSGPGGAIVRADVERSLAGTAAPTDEKRRPGLDLDAMRAAIAAAMARSKREIPHYYLEHQVDVGNCEVWLARTNAERHPDQRLLMSALTLKAVALAARRFPDFNGFHRDGKFEPSSAIHPGVAISIRGGGLAAPAMHDADKFALDDLMRRMRDLVQRMRAGRIRSSEIADATITVSSLGERGVDALYGVIYPPQVAIIGFGKVAVRPWVIDGAIGPRPVVTVTLAADHRVSDGHAGARFLAEIGKLLQEPEKL
jgi:pyruvate dehydrogenase E2 component (dihydrolipoamide acetyltransferase)